MIDKIIESLLAKVSEQGVVYTVLVMFIFYQQSSVNYWRQKCEEFFQEDRERRKDETERLRHLDKLSDDIINKELQ